MSVKIIDWVWSNSRETGTHLLMLLAIADHANDDGICWPSIARLAQRARVKERQAQYIIKQLEESGAIEIRRGVGRNNTSVYIVKGATNCTISDIEKVQYIARADTGKGAVQRAEKVQSSAEKGAVAIAPDPSLEPSTDPSLEPSVVVDVAGGMRPAKDLSSRDKRRKPKPETYTSDVSDADPSPPFRPPPVPEESAVAEVLLGAAICANDEQARLDAAGLLVEYPSEWIVRAALQTAERSDVKNPHAYLLKTLSNWQREKGPRPARVNPGGESTEASRRAKYIPEEYSDIILG